MTWSTTVLKLTTLDLRTGEWTVQGVYNDRGNSPASVLYETVKAYVIWHSRFSFMDCWPINLARAVRADTTREWT